MVKLALWMRRIPVDPASSFSSLANVYRAHVGMLRMIPQNGSFDAIAFIGITDRSADRCIIPECPPPASPLEFRSRS